MTTASIELSQEFRNLLEEQIADHDQFDTVDEFVAQATAEKIQQEAKEEHRSRVHRWPNHLGKAKLHRRVFNLSVVRTVTYALQRLYD